MASCLQGAWFRVASLGVATPSLVIAVGKPSVAAQGPSAPQSGGKIRKNTLSQSKMLSVGTEISVAAQGPNPETLISVATAITKLGVLHGRSSGV